MAIPPIGTPEAPPSLGRARLGKTPAARDAHDALRGLERAARSFLLYEAHNDAIRVFLEEYQTCMREALQHGPLHLEIAPFTITREDEVIYREQDREKSLAFRLYRDGVRHLTMHPGMDWPEMLRLLEIMSIRFTGVRQHEDDVVTLLWKAGFESVQISAVEGFDPDEEALSLDGFEDEAELLRLTDAGIRPPLEFDTPISTPGEPKPVDFALVPYEERERILQEINTFELPVHAVRLVLSMVELAADPADSTSVADLLPVLADVRDFLLAEGQADMLLTLARAVADARHLAPDRLSRELLRFVDRRAIRRLLHSASLGREDEAPDDLVALLTLVEGPRVPDLLEVAALERSAAARQLAQLLLAALIRKQTVDIARLLQRTEGPVAGDLLRAAQVSHPEDAVRLALILVRRPDPEVQEAVLAGVQTVRAWATDPDDLLAFMQSPELRVRIAAVEKLAEGEKPGTLRLLAEHLDGQPFGPIDPAEAMAIGRAMARLDPKGTWRRMAGWVKPTGLLSRLAELSVHERHRFAGVAGLTNLDDPRVDGHLEWLANRAGARLGDVCRRGLHERKRRREGR